MLYVKSKLIQGGSVFMLAVLFTNTGHALERYQRGVSKDDGISYTIGLEYEEGDYGTSDSTEVWRIPVGLDYRKGQFIAGANIPYISAESTGNVTISTMRMRTVITSSTSDASGIGDLKLYAGYNIPAAARVYHVIGYVKLPTADENEGLGTGESDYALEGGATFAVEKAIVYTNLGYQINGDTATIDYDDIFYASASMTFAQPNGNKLGASIDYSQSVTAGFDDALGVTGFMLLPQANQRSLYLYLELGLSDGSPDFGAGATYRFQ